MGQSGTSANDLRSELFPLVPLPAPATSAQPQPGHGLSPGENLGMGLTTSTAKPSPPSRRMEFSLQAAPGDLLSWELPSGEVMASTLAQTAQIKPEPLIILAQDNSQDETLPEIDPELGIIRVRDLPADSELGILRVREQPLVPAGSSQVAPKIGFLNVRMAVASSDNILLAVNDVGGLTGDEFLRPEVSLGFYPSLGPQTFLLANVDFSLQRYTTQSEFNYNDLRLRLGVRQALFPRTYGQLMVTHQQLYRPESPPFRFFENTALSFTLGRRDPLTNRLTLNSYYQLQLNDAESQASPDSPKNFSDFDRVTQYLGGSLSYAINPQWLTGVSYQLALADYTGQQRYDAFHQIIGQLTYRITPDIRMNLYGGWSFGRSSDPLIRFDDTLFGITVDATIPLF